MKRADQWVHDHRAEWSYEKLVQWVRPGERVLHLGAGDCRLDLLLNPDFALGRGIRRRRPDFFFLKKSVRCPRINLTFFVENAASSFVSVLAANAKSGLKNRMGCKLIAVDVDNHNEMTLPVTFYDGKTPPFSDQSVDVVLLLSVLHHAKDPVAVLSEAHRVARCAVIVFEDRNESVTDRIIFRKFHRFLRWPQGFSLPNLEWTRDPWFRLATTVGFKTSWEGLIGRQLGPFASYGIRFVWEPFHTQNRTWPKTPTTNSFDKRGVEMAVTGEKS
ncbi:MAG: methyltransferase domain-containing protein [Elusimicrobia bacterium]|nr:methyltransferase domain-containing protein [Elusimicrobiota bacterium]